MMTTLDQLPVTEAGIVERTPEDKAKRIVFHALFPMHPYYTEVEMQMTLEREEETQNWLRPSAAVALLTDALSSSTEIEALRAREAELRAAFIRLLDACDRYNGIFSHGKPGLAAQHQGKMVLAVTHAYRVLGIGRTEAQAR